MATTTGSRQASWAYIEHEHRDLVRGINRIHEVACEVGQRATPDVSADVLGVLRWFETTLEPHMAWEEAMLYPEIDRRAGTPWATRAARFDHQQIREVVAGLRLGHRELADRRTVDPQADVRCRLYGLETLLRAHVEREERFLIPELNEDLEVSRIEVERSGSHALGPSRHQA
jgi:hemerythrin-like domain-containing protein